MKCVCHKCQEEYSPVGGGHCMACHLTFTSDGGFDKHRVGKYQPNERRCLTTEEMNKAGWRFTPRGWTPWKERVF